MSEERLRLYFQLLGLLIEIELLVVGVQVRGVGAEPVADRPVDRGERALLERRGGNHAAVRSC